MSLLGSLNWKGFAEAGLQPGSFARPGALRKGNGKPSWSS